MRKERVMGKRRKAPTKRVLKQIKRKKGTESMWDET